MKSIVSCFLKVIFLAALLAGCAATAPAPSEQIIGTWRSEVGGFDVITTYSSETVTVEGFSPRAYALNGSELVIEGDTISSRTVSFPSSSEMVQVDGMTATEHRFTRIAP
ncbi:MAG: hypothetical protein ISP91_18005 [Pseudomonadales bacterium]|jgi:hypothetical protein|nr:hypothetical protein [Pseudomonadales bacterium]